MKVHKTYRLVIAVCDSEIIGKTYEEGKKILDLKERFYKGEKLSREEAEKAMIEYSKEDATFNIAGKKSVQTALNCGLISEEGVKKIKGIPYALVLL